MKDRLETRVLALFLLVLVLLVGITVAAVGNIRASLASSDWVNQTHAVISEADALYSALTEGEAALRAYLLTGAARDLAACRRAYAAAAEHLELAKALAGSGTKPHTEFLELHPLVARRVDVTRELITIFQQKGSAAVRKPLAADAGDLRETTP